MEFIGEYLKNVRREKKIKIISVSNELKISVDILKDIEKDYFPKYIDTVFLIGHIRSYAKFLDLNHDEIIENFKIQNLYDNINPKKEISKPIKTISLYSIPKALSYFVVVFFASGFYFLFIKSNDFQNEYAMTPDVPENLRSYLELTEMNITLSEISNKANYNKIIIEQQKILENQLFNNTDSSSVLASSPKDKDIKKFNQNIILKFLNPTWIQLRDSKDEIVFSKMMGKDDEYVYQVFDNYTLTAGNAGNIIVSLDNLVMGKIGKAGEVVDSITINKNFNQ